MSQQNLVMARFMYEMNQLGFVAAAFQYENAAYPTECGDLGRGRVGLSGTGIGFKSVSDQCWTATVHVTVSLHRPIHSPNVTMSCQICGVMSDAQNKSPVVGLPQCHFRTCCPQS